jgi:predicted kinase
MGEAQMLIVTIGMSGSGKNYLLDQLSSTFDNIKAVEPDDIRRHVLGSVNDQSDGKKVFAIAGHEVRHALPRYDIVFFNATNLNWSQTTKMVSGWTTDPVIYIFMMDSEDYDLCRERVVKDIQSGTDRSDVPEDVMQKQHERFKQCLKNATDDDLFGNWSIFLYKDNISELISTIKEELNGQKAAKSNEG